MEGGLGGGRSASFPGEIKPHCLFVLLLSACDECRIDKPKKNGIIENKTQDKRSMKDKHKIRSDQIRSGQVRSDQIDTKNKTDMIRKRNKIGKISTMYTVNIRGDLDTFLPSLPSFPSFPSFPFFPSFPSLS